MADHQSFEGRVAHTPEGAEVYEKIVTQGPDSLQARRLNLEFEALAFIAMHDDTLAPRLVSAYTIPGQQLGTEFVHGLGTVPLDQRLAIVDRLHAIDAGGELGEPQGSDEYYAQSETRITELHEAGVLRGANRWMLRGPRNEMRRRMQAVDAFPTAPTHTDAKQAHFGWLASGETEHPVAIDWEQLHEGPYLADYAFMSIRHPLERVAITRHLQGVFADNPKQLTRLSEAMKALETHLLIKAIHDRAFQRREPNRESLFQRVSPIPVDDLQRVLGQIMLHTGPLWRNLGWRPTEEDWQHVTDLHRIS